MKKLTLSNDIVITLNNVQDRLSESYNDVKPLVRKPNYELNENYADINTSAVIILGKYTLEILLANNPKTCEYERFVHIVETGCSYSF